MCFSSFLCALHVQVVSAFSSTSLYVPKGAARDVFDAKRSQEVEEVNRQVQEQLDGQRQSLTRLLAGLNITSVLMTLTDYLTTGAHGVVKSLCSSTGRSEKIIQRLKALQTTALPPSGTATLEANDRLLQPLVATQEGTFDNVKSNPYVIKLGYLWDLHSILCTVVRHSAFPQVQTNFCSICSGEFSELSVRPLNSTGERYSDHVVSF